MTGSATAQVKQQRVLALYVTTPGAAGAASFETVYQRVFSNELGSRIDFHSEFIDVARFSMPGYPDALGDFLRFKYKHLPLDAVIATTEGALEFVERFRTDLFPGIPVVFVDRTASSPPRPGMTGVRAPLDLGGTLDLALMLQPATRHVFVVGGISEFDRFYERLARQQLERFAGRVTLTYLRGIPLADLRRTVADLPPNSIIYFLTLGEDGAGARFRSIDALDQLSAVANVPIYGWNGVAMSHGIVGGRLYTNEIVAERTAALTLRILHGERPDSIPVLPLDPDLSQVDWRELRRWGISEARVPQGTTILFREPSLWDRYRVYMAGALALMLFQTALIAGLLVQRARRRRIEAALRLNQATLHASSQQISSLFGRLIGAQETERTRIARDLHDDVSQRIAGLSIMISSLKRGLPDQAPGADLKSALTSLQRNTTALAEEIRHLSHDLHPGVLQHAGLTAALNVFCGEFAKQHAIAVTCTADDDIGHVQADTALCLYRITQEALRNVVKHAGARHVDVALTRTAERIQLSIADDGNGFDLARTRAKGAGLGLVSIDERARMLGGRVDIHTTPRGGTRVQVQIPGSRETGAPDVATLPSQSRERWAVTD